MPALISFASIIKPKLKVMNAESSFGLFHSILAQTLNEWCNSWVPLQIGTATGTITTPSGYTYPFIYPFLRANITQMYFSDLQVKACALGNNGEDFYPKLFAYIGLMITQQLVSWSTNPISATGIPNPIWLTGVGTGFITSHFYNVGLAYKMLLKVKPPADEDVFDYTWEQFEQKLKFAINTIPPMIMPVMGVAPFGVFAGIGTIKITV